MASWASNRKKTYAGLFIFAILVIIVIPLFLIFYKPPTCFDGLRNGNEKDIDCGGSCVKLCQSAFLPARIRWGGTKFEKIGKGLYNASSYIENGNIGGAADAVPYRMAFYDSSGLLITEKKGFVDIPPHRDILVFENAIDTKDAVPVKATFEFVSPPNWYKSHDTIENIAITNKDYKDGNNNTSSLSVVIENKGLTPFYNINLSALLYDSEENVIGFSKTVVDELTAKGKQDVVFTWPFGRDGRVVTIEILPSVASPHDDK